MDFDNGVIAIVSIHGKKKICHNADDVYYFLYDNGIDHELAADAQGWSELASIGETYNEVDFDIYIE